MKLTFEEVIENQRKCGIGLQMKQKKDHIL